MSTDNLFDKAILSKYQTSGPRYTSYPTALAFSEQFFNDDVIKAVKTSLNRDLSLYVHIPFCHQLCYYCGCNKVVTRHNSKADEYLDYLEQEIETRGALFADYSVTQLHLGGGSPSFFSIEQHSRLIRALKIAFNFDNNTDMSIEVDPRRIDTDYIDALAGLGFSRLSIGVQDTDPKVQSAINRIQSTIHISKLLVRAKARGMRSTNLDLIYGLPHQTTATFSKTLDDVLAMAPDRISLFSYAHLPARFAAQRKIKEHWLPGSDAKLDLMAMAINRLKDAGYQMIGMDHFALPNDPLALALSEKRLRRNFQGYTCIEDSDLLGLGVSAISNIDKCFSQNHKDLKSYYSSVTVGGHGVERGVELSEDDRLRGFVIENLMCNLQIDKGLVEVLFDVDFDTYFEQQLQLLTGRFDSDLVQNTADAIVIAPHARLLVRNICMCFDAYIQDQGKQRYSSTI